MTNTPETAGINFQERVLKMSAKEIIMAMVEGLRNPSTAIDMTNYGMKNTFTGICYGCAATNTICKIAGTDLESIVDWVGPRLYGYLAFRKHDTIKLQAEESFIRIFETAINFLRQGNIVYYNKHANYIGIAKIVIPENFPYYLPTLRNGYTPSELEVYEKLASAQPVPKN